jgi:hypothetical protein
MLLWPVLLGIYSREGLSAVVETPWFLRQTYFPCRLQNVFGLLFFFKVAIGDEKFKL